MEEKINRAIAMMENLTYILPESSIILTNKYTIEEITDCVSEGYSVENIGIAENPIYPLRGIHYMKNNYVFVDIGDKHQIQYLIERLKTLIE